MPVAATHLSRFERDVKTDVVREHKKRGTIKETWKSKLSKGTPAVAACNWAAATGDSVRIVVSDYVHSTLYSAIEQELRDRRVEDRANAAGSA